MKSNDKGWIFFIKKLIIKIIRTKFDINFKYDKILKWCETFWLCGQTTPNKVDNNPENWKSSLIELWPRGNPVTKNQMYWKKT
jgi:hypothetical protein